MSLLFKLFGIGYDKEGFDKYGYDKNGYNRLGYNEHGFNNSGFDSNGYNKNGYNKSGFNKLGYDNRGYDRWGYNKYGYDNEGFNIDGYNKDGYNINGFNKFGFNKDGLDKEGYSYGGFNHLGYDREGFGRDGFDKHGFDKNGYAIDGYDKDGFNKYGINRHGYNRKGYNQQGFDQHGFDMEGYNHEGYNRNGFDKYGFNKDGFDKNGKFFIDLKIGQTVYHSLFEIGVIGNFEPNNEYITICFDTVGDKTFRFSPSILQYISIELPEKIKKRLELKKQGLYQVVDDIERRYFNHVTQTIKHNFKGENFSYSGSFNDFSDSFELDTFATYQKAYSAHKHYTDLINEPYFARLDYKENQGLYIGKNEIKGEVIEWTDPICSLYYNYQMYIGNRKYKLSLVRNFDIVNGLYLGFDDAYNYSNQNIDDKDNIYSIDDPLLLKIIKTNRDNKRISDIISTIQSNQYNIISNNREKNLVVLGCAGSGKTMIMFHRIRFILRNQIYFDADSVYIISPTGILLNESRDLMTDLKLKKVNAFSTTKFYKFIVSKYYTKLNGIVSEKFKNINKDSNLKVEFTRNIYSKEKLNQLYKQVDSIYEIYHIREEYINIEKSRLLVETNDLVCGDYQSLDTGLINQNKAYKVKEFYIESVDELKGISSQNLELIKKHMSNLSVDKTFRINVLDFLILNNSAYGQTKLTGKGTIYLDEDCLYNTFKLFEYTGFGEVDSEYKFDKSWYKDPYEFYRKFIILEDKINKLFEFEKGVCENYEFYVIDSLLCDWKEKNNISTNCTYEFELFVHSYICCKRLGPVSTSNLMLFVDEFQEYSAEELSLTEELFPNASINLFGDVNQCTNVKGIVNLSSIEGVLEKYDKFEINQNYRNARNVTEYVNKVFSMDMMPIGINGNLIELKYDLSCFELPEDNDRVALIVKNESTIPEDILMSNKFSLLEATENGLSREKINVLTIQQAKGLEFERVYVIRNEMDRNEEYVAFTRALNDLVILKK